MQLFNLKYLYSPLRPSGIPARSMPGQALPRRGEASLPWLIILTSFFLLLEFSFFIQCNRVYLSDYTFVSKNLSIPAAIIPGVLYFIAAQCSVHLLYCLGLWVVIEWSFGFIVRHCEERFLRRSNPVLDVSEYETASVLTSKTGLLRRKKRSSQRQTFTSHKLYFVIAVWILSVLTIITANQYYFPNSKFAELSSLILWNDTITKLAFFMLSTCCGIIILLALLEFISKYTRVFLTVLILASTIITIFVFKPSSSLTTPATASRPNIILIGLDSLRPDFLSYFGNERATPFLDSFLEQSAVFAEAVTPLARTFPSWSSLLIGNYPREIHIRSNLASQHELDLTGSLPTILQHQGYETIYATDETRFSNIDKNFGFDRIISPPMGLNDFLIGNFNDFPLTNLVVNTRAGKHLFPHSYANRPVYFTYDPNSFLHELQPMLEEQHAKPLFLAAHFCLTHAPYLWADLSGKNLSAQERYMESIVRADKQIQDFFALLKKNHLLDHAIVVLLSDHGETLEFAGDRITEKDLYVSSKTSAPPKFYPRSLDHEEMNQSAGHGTDVMGLPQYHTLLAFQFYGTSAYQSRDIPGVVTLLDIKPTLLEYLKLPSSQASGISLLAAIQGREQTLNERHIFLESDYSPSAIRTVYPEVRKVMLEGIDIFQINPVTTRLTVKNEMTAKIISSKQYADIYGEWMLALYPQDKHHRMPILINLNNGQWTNEMQSEFAQHSPAAVMMERLREFYGEELV
jgi:arylsulfatase A-like enzyme